MEYWNIGILECWMDGWVDEWMDERMVNSVVAGLVEAGTGVSDSGYRCLITACAKTAACRSQCCQIDKVDLNS